MTTNKPSNSDYYNVQNKVDTNYNDYLRFNLLAMKESELIKRVKDFVVMNMNLEFPEEFEYTDRYSGISVDVDANMDMIFTLKTFDGKSIYDKNKTFDTLNLRKGYD